MKITKLFFLFLVYILFYRCAFSQTNTKLIDKAYNAYYKEKNWTKASELFSELKKLNPTYPDYTVRLAFAYYRNDQYEKAISALKDALEIGPWPDIYYNYISASYARLKKPDEAMYWLQKSIQAGWPRYLSLKKDKDFDIIRNKSGFKQIFGIKENIDTTDPAQRWKADLEFIMEKMKLLHYNMYNTNPPEVWDSLYSKINGNIPRMNSEEIILNFMKLAALAGEGHTKVLPPESGPMAFHSLPIELYYFKDGFFVEKAIKKYKDLVGKKIISIGSKGIDELFKKCFVYRGHDNKMHYIKMAPRYLVMMEALKDMGAVSELDKVDLKVEDSNGKGKIESVESMTMNKIDDLPEKEWVAMNNYSMNPLPLYLKDSEKDFWFEYLPGQNLMYAHIHYIVNNDQVRFFGVVDSLFKTIDRQHIKNLVLDLRNCGGGNSEYNKYLIAAILQHPKINEKKHFYTIIGRETFSAAINLVTDLEYRTNSVFVGEPTGSKPDFIGESSVLKLPYSGLYLVISNRYHQGGANNSLDKRPWIAPSILIQLSSKEYAENDDPVMDFILNEIKTH